MSFAIMIFLLCDDGGTVFCCCLLLHGSFSLLLSYNSVPAFRHTPAVTVVSFFVAVAVAVASCWFCCCIYCWCWFLRLTFIVVVRCILAILNFWACFVINEWMNEWITPLNNIVLLLLLVSNCLPVCLPANEWINQSSNYCSAACLLSATVQYSALIWNSHLCRDVLLVVYWLLQYTHFFCTN